MAERLIKFYQVILQTLLAVLLTIAAYNAKVICTEQDDIKQQIDRLRLNQVKILTLLKAEPAKVCTKTGLFKCFDMVSVIQLNQ